MTEAERALLGRIRFRAQGARKDLADRLLATYDLIRKSLTERELAEAIRSGQVEALLNEVLKEDATGPFTPLRRAVDRTVMDAGEFSTFDVPTRFRLTVSQEFGRLSPEVIQAARDLDTRVVRGLAEEVRATVKQHVGRGMEEGLGPRTISRGAREVLDLAPNQEAAIANFRRMLEANDPEALTRALRDRRFDGTVRKAMERGGLTTEQIDSMTSAYHRKMVAFNAETHARTMALDAQRSGQRLAWQDAIARGVVGASDLRRKWVTVGDNRVRPEHRALNGTVVGFNEPYPNGEMVPGESTYNCRCIERVFVTQEAIAA